MTCTGGRLAAFARIKNQLSVPRDVRRYPVKQPWAASSWARIFKASHPLQSCFHRLGSAGQFQPRVYGEGRLIIAMQKLASLRDCFAKFGDKPWHGRKEQRVDWRIGNDHIQVVTWYHSVWQLSPMGTKSRLTAVQSGIICVSGWITMRCTGANSATPMGRLLLRRIVPPHRLRCIGPVTTNVIQSKSHGRGRMEPMSQNRTTRSKVISAARDHQADCNLDLLRGRYAMGLL